MAVEVVIKWVDNVCPDPIKDQIGSYKAGDPVFAAVPGYDFGKEIFKSPANGGKFFILTVTDRDLADLKAFTVPEETVVNLEIVTTRRRRYRLAINEFPLVVRNQIVSTGRYSATWNQIKGFLENKAQGTRA